jgi:MFS family permease
MMAVFNTAQENITAVYGWSDSEASVYIVTLTTILPVGAAIGAFASGPIASRLGRRGTILLSDLLAIIGMVLTLPVNIYSFYTGRFLVGLAAGSFSNVIPIYICETLPMDYKGSGGVIYVFEYCCGVLVSWGLGFGLPDDNDPDNEWWRIMFGLPVVMLLIQMIFLLFIYTTDTPAYLARNTSEVNRSNLHISLSKLYIDPKELNHELESLMSSATETHLTKVSFSDLIGPRYRKQLLIGILINFFMEMTGFYGVIFYSNAIFLLVWSQTTATLFTSLLGVAELIGSLVCFLIIDRLGRRAVFLLGQGSCTVCLFLIGVFWWCSWHIALVCVFILLVFFFALTLDTCVWIYNSEILPDKGSGICTMVNWVTTIGISVVFPIIVDSEIGLPGAAMIFGGISFVGTCFMFKFVKETKGKTADLIDKEFLKN